ncbi:hypothetical protein TSAR_001490 [Trichomalopsis sarcophagae]|uniref:Uncharacterized protein n=1 Tax=Trichomalopsis sarcophagae TaxID=543379 RepID=A0A232EXM5_9HYME|nr:hypothetical protein TSAR_001490 [Trichomalopsis sarcophagae]
MANNVTSYERVSHEAMLPRTFQSDRSRTNVFYTYLFGLLLLVFIGISIYGYEGVSHKAMLPRTFQRDRSRTNDYWFVNVCSITLSTIFLLFLNLATLGTYTLGKQELTEKGTEINTFQPTAPQNENAV